LSRILDLLQLGDSAFPSGGFAFSNGLESLAKLGHIRAMEDFEGYLECHLEQIAGAEIPFLNSAQAAWGDAPAASLADLLAADARARESALQFLSAGAHP